MARRNLRRAGTNLLKGSLLGGALCATGVMPLMADTDVEFSGTLIADPCQVDTDSEDQTVEFGPVAAKTFINHEQSASARFSVWLRECDLAMGSQVTVTFYGQKDEVNPTLFMVDGTAKGIALALSDSSGHAVTPGSEQPPQTLNDGDTELKWEARIQSTAGSQVTEGDFVSVVTFSLEYE